MIRETSHITAELLRWDSVIIRDAVQDGYNYLDGIFALASVENRMGMVSWLKIGGTKWITHYAEEIKLWEDAYEKFREKERSKMKTDESYEMQLLKEILPFVRVPPDIKGYNLCMDKIQKIRKYLSEYFYNQLVFIHKSDTCYATKRAEQMVDECFKSHTEQFKQG